MAEQAYAGEELALFARAENWKRYLVSEISPFLGARVLEVGAGIGSTARAFADVIRATTRPIDWVCLEPDRRNAQQLESLVAGGELPSSCAVRCGTIGDLDPGLRYDAILYVDVLEHIEDDRRELREAGAHLTDGGHLVVVSPAHPWLFSPFDAAIGHHRRYTRRSLRDAAPGELACVRLRYLDAIGLLASGANRVLLKQKTPTAREIRVWDGLMVPGSRWIDPWLLHRVGKSVLGVWRRRA